MTLNHKGLGVKFGGRCPVCNGDTGNRDFEKEKTALYRSQDGRFFPVHPECAGGSTKSAVGGGIKYRNEPKAVVEC